MENEKSKFLVFSKWIIGVIVSIIVIFLIYFSVISVISVKRKVAETNQLFGKSETEVNKFKERLYNDSTFIKLNKEKALYQSRLEMAKTDSIGLILNLIDSTACLELNGVVIHKTKISKYKLSQAFNELDIFALSNIFSKPFNITNDISSIKKEPIMIKIAPKDTSEYIPDVTPDTSNFEPVNYILEMDNGIRIYVYQEEKDNKSDIRAQFYFDLSDRLDNTLSAMKKGISFKIPDYKLFIKIRIPKSEAKIIYRAIPKNGQVVVYI